MVRICEADLIDIVLAGGNLSGRGGGSQREDAVGISLGRDSDTGSGGDGADKNLHTPVHQVVVRVDRLLCIVFIVLRVELDLKTALGVDLLNGDLSAALCSIAVNRSAAGERTDKADLQCFAARSVFLRAAACKQADEHNQC